MKHTTEPQRREFLGAWIPREQKNYVRQQAQQEDRSITYIVRQAISVHEQLSKLKTNQKEEVR